MQTILITSAAEGRGNKIESAVEKLEVKVSGAHADTAPAFSAFLAAIADCEVEVVKQTKNGAVTVLQRTKALDLFECAQGNGGMIEGYSTTTTNHIQSCIELSAVKDHALNLTDGEHFELTILGFPVTAGITYQIEITPIPGRARTMRHVVYEKQRFSEDSPREIDVTEAGVLAIPYDAYDKVELTPRGNGNRETFNKQSAISLMRDGLIVRGTYTSADGFSKINPFNRMILLDVANYALARITTNADVNILIVSGKTLL